MHQLEAAGRIMKLAASILQARLGPGLLNVGSIRSGLAIILVMHAQYSHANIATNSEARLERASLHALVKSWLARPFFTKQTESQLKADHSTG